MTASASPRVVHLAAFVRRHQGRVGALLMALVAAALVLDYFQSGLLGPHLIGLRLIYAALATVIIGYLWLLSAVPTTPRATAARAQPK